MFLSKYDNESTSIDDIKQRPHYEMGETPDCISAKSNAHKDDHLITTNQEKICKIIALKNSSGYISAGRDGSILLWRKKDLSIEVTTQ